MNKQIPWARMLVEGGVIVLSILLAFSIEAWWDGVQDRDRERRYLVALRQEFTAVQEAGVQESRQRSQDAALGLLGQAQGEPRAPADSLYWWLSGLSQQIEFNPPRAVFDDLVSSGDMQLIESDSLRLALAYYPAVLEFVRQADERAWATWNDRMQPLLENTVPRVDRLRLGTFGGGGTRELPFGPSPHPTDWDSLFNDRGFESMLAERWMRLQQATDWHGIALQLVDDIIRLIDDRLEAI